MTVDIPCFENSGHEATFYCAECEADFCQRCFTEVHKPKVLSRHEGIPISEKPIKLPKCAQHSYNTAEFLCIKQGCEASKKIMCHTCLLTGEHRAHTYVLLMDQLLKNSNELKEIHKKLEDYIEKEKEYQKKIQKEIQSFNVNGQIFRSVCEKISAEFDAKKQEALDKLETFAKDSLETRTSLDSFLKLNLEENENLKKDLESRLKLKNNLLNVDEIKISAKERCADINFLEESDLGMNSYKFALTDRMKLKISKFELDSNDKEFLKF